MKKIYIISILALAIGIFLLTRASKDLSNYSSFADATKSSSSVKIVGKLMLDQEMYYNPEKDPNYFSFFVEDNEGIAKKVVLRDAKPQDFELSEQIVLTGKMEGEDFHASSVLLKCPSKYTDEELYLKTDS